MKRKGLSSKNKIIIAFGTLGLFVFAGILSLALVLAASLQNLTSNISVSYVSNNVSATVTGKYWVTGNAKTTMDTVTFEPGSETVTEEMSPGAIVLTTANNKVVFEYAFTNLSTNAAFTVELTNSPRTDAGAEYVNMTEKYYVSAVELTTTDFATLTGENTINIQPILKQRTGETDKVYIYVIASITNVADNAAYNGSFEWELKYVEPANIKTINLDNNGGTTAPATMEIVLISGDTVNMPAIFTLPTHTEKEFDGYFTATTEGTKYIAADGSPVHVCNLSDGDTLHAQWYQLLEISNGELTGVTEMGKQQSELILPNTVTSIAVDAFDGCTNLTSVTIPVGATVPANTFDDFDGIEITGPIYTSAPLGTATNVTLHVVGNNLEVSGSAYDNCTGLVAIEIPGSATISSKMFTGCTNLRSITAPIYHRNYLDEYLTNVNLTLNGTQTTISSCAFEWCSAGITSLTIAGGITTIGETAFNGFPASSITLGDNVVTIGHGAFKNSSDLVDITLGNGVTTIGDEAFDSDENLETVTFGSSVARIERYAFHYCRKIEEIELPSTVNYIGDGAFNGCWGLTSMVLNGTNLVLDDCVFYGCSYLTSVTIGSGVIAIGKDIFSDAPVANVTFVDTTSTWTISDELGGAGEITADDWAPNNDTSENATYLKSTYSDKYWTKN